MAKPFKVALKEDAPQIGLLLSLPSPEIVEICVEAGFDWLFLDMEHGLLDFIITQRMIQAAAGRASCIVRVPANEPVWISKALDLGADGLIFPHINTAEEAAACVRAALYPPLGARSIGIARGQGYGVRVKETVAGANADVTLIAQAEHIDAARHIESILEVPGIDAVFIGPFDLSASLGLPGKIDDVRVQDAIGTILAASRIRRIPAGIFAAVPEAARAACTRGFSFVCAGTDSSLLARTAKETVDIVRSR
ncbi:MAG: aldolase/citrate lyase family protein [Candidatus Aminicenantes bacterium]|nr:aldolase/citrate lyase family protein [Candidatus Aminicenantes bacterium]